MGHGRVLPIQSLSPHISRGYGRRASGACLSELQTYMLIVLEFRSNGAGYCERFAT